MISPYEILALLIVLPIVGVGMWINSRYDTDGAPVVEFEQWCARERPLLFAIRLAPEGSKSFLESLRARVGQASTVQHQRGRYPWTRYSFAISMDVDSDSVVRGRIERATIRRVRATWPDLGAALDECLAAASSSGAAWIHTELNEGDESRGVERRGRGWTATIDRGVMKDLELAPTPPDWAK